MYIGNQARITDDHITASHSEDASRPRSHEIQLPVPHTCVFDTAKKPSKSFVFLGLKDLADQWYTESSIAVESRGNSIIYGPVCNGG
jgi:hypothetical protein